MKKLTIALIVLLYSFIGANSVFAAANTWTHKADFGGTARYGAVSFSVASKGYIGTGYDGSSLFEKDFWEYDPATSSWTQKADFGGIGRYEAVGFSIGSKGYIGTGYASSVTKDFWEYNPVTNTWTRKADFGGTARMRAIGFSIDNKGYIGTGSIDQSASGTKDFWEYDPIANTWIQKANFGGTGRNEAVGFSIGSKGYIGTGMDGSYSKDFWEYNPATDTWTRKADFRGTGRMVAVGFSIGSKGYIGTGYAPSLAKDFWEYDSVTNTWIQKADFDGRERGMAVGLSIGSKGYIGTGWDQDLSFKKDFLEYEPTDTTPDQFIFNYETGVDLNTVVTSNTITVSGINEQADISITGGTYSINGLAYTSDNGKVNNGDTVTVQVTSSAHYSTTAEATLTIGSVSDTFSVTTKDGTIKIKITPRSINMLKKETIRVAIYSSADFSPLNIHSKRLTFGATGDEQSLIGCVQKNANRAVYLFSTEKTGFKCGDTVGTLKVKTLSGELFIGTDSVKIVPCR